MSELKRICVFGTGQVGRTIATKLDEIGHRVVVGTRDPAATLRRAESDNAGTPSFATWHEQHPNIALATLPEAAEQGELCVNATNGAGSIAALEAAGERNIAGKVLIDVANPLDFSKGMPPFLSVCNTDSLAEQIQRRFPETNVVKTLNTMNAHLMVDPRSLAGGEHTVFVSGNDAEAKRSVNDILRSFGWEDIVDLGDITTARGTEMVLPIWLRAWSVVGSAQFQFKLVR